MRSTRVSIRGSRLLIHPPPGCGRHGCLFEGHDSTSTPHTTSRDARRRCETIVAFGSTYTALHCVPIRWGRSPTASFLSLAVVYDAPFHRIVSPSSMKHTHDRGWSSTPTSTGARDGCATSRVRDDRSRAMSLAFDEFGRPFIIIKVRARPRRARGGGRARARARATTTTTTTDPSIIHPRARVRRRRAKGSWTDGNDARRNKGKSLAFVESRRSARTSRRRRAWRGR